MVDGLGRALNVSNVTAVGTTVSGACQFVANPKNASFDIHTATVTGKLTLAKAAASIDITFTFVENAAYSKEGEYISGDRSVFLAC